VEAQTQVERKVCPHCNGAGWIRVETPGRLVPRVEMCHCLRKEVGLRRADRLLAASGIPAKALQRWRFRDFQPDQCKMSSGALRPQVVATMQKIKAECMAYAKKPEGWRVLMGPCGSGKTHLAYAIAGSCQKRGMAVFVATAPDMLDMLRASYRTEQFDQRFEELRNVGLLVIDDLATEQATAWVLEKMYQLVNHRYMAELPLIITTNLNIRKHPAQIDERILSRLLEGTEQQNGRCRLWILPAASYRESSGKVHSRR